MKHMCLLTEVEVFTCGDTESAAKEKWGGMRREQSMEMLREILYVSMDHIFLKLRNVKL